MSEQDLDKMEEGAQKTKRFWGQELDALRHGVTDEMYTHIANCSPPAIISMINDIRNLRKKLAKKNTELFHTEQVTGCQAHEMGSIGPCTCRREMGG